MKFIKYKNKISNLYNLELVSWFEDQIAFVFNQNNSCSNIFIGHGKEFEKVYASTYFSFCEFLKGDNTFFDLDEELKKSEKLIQILEEGNINGI